MFLVRVLSEHLKVSPLSEYVFPSAEGGFLRYDNFMPRVWAKATAAAGFEGLTFHELRHTCAAILIDHGANPLEIQRRLGHKDIGTTLAHYGHLFPNREDALNETFERVHAKHARPHCGLKSPVSRTPRRGRCHLPGETMVGGTGIEPVTSSV
jgi:integrase